jgi:hypothetical protein
MKRILGVLTVAIAALALLAQSADAGPRKHRHHHIDKRVKVAGVVTGAAATVTFLSLNDWTFNGSWNKRQANGLTTGGAYALTSIGCMAVSPIVATAFANRPLTLREAHVLTANCVVPIVGGLIVNAAFDANPHWEPAPARPVRVARKKRR